MNRKKIYIVGAGVSGLVAAINLEKHGYKPIIIEANNSLGGRVQTDIVNNYVLDRGFQVLLTSYPAAQKYLNFEELHLRYFLPGAVIFKNGKQKIVGDPLRNIGLLFPTLFSGIGTIKDKLKILQLNTKLKNKSIEDIFNDKEQTTISYLNQFGFSNAIIRDFFKPFFTGIFLENDLSTSSRMFEFVYKMFGSGHAALPKNGIGEITRQLSEQLQNTAILFNLKAKKVTGQAIELENGDLLKSNYTIVTANHEQLIPKLKKQTVEWKSCTNLYYEVDNVAFKKPLIGLVPDKESIINNIAFSTQLQTNVNDKELLSVTVIDTQNLSDDELILKVKDELKSFCNIQVGSFIKLYHIPKSLPNVSNIQYDCEESETQLTQNIFLAGDVQLNGSLNAAMLSGEKAAMGIIKALKN